MPEPVSLTVDFTWLRAILTMLASATVIAVACVSGCRHVRRAVLQVLDELHANTTATQKNGRSLEEIKNELGAGNRRFNSIEQRLAGHEATIAGLARRVG